MLEKCNYSIHGKSVGFARCALFGLADVSRPKKWHEHTFHRELQKELHLHILPTCPPLWGIHLPACGQQLAF